MENHEDRERSKSAALPASVFIKIRLGELSDRLTTFPDNQGRRVSVDSGIGREAQGFSTYQKFNIVINVVATVQENAILQVGASAQTVIVESRRVTPPD
jgi:hypothetical protein